MMFSYVLQAICAFGCMMSMALAAPTTVGTSSTDSALANAKATVTDATNRISQSFQSYCDGIHTYLPPSSGEPIQRCRVFADNSHMLTRIPFPTLEPQQVYADSLVMLRDDLHQAQHTMTSLSNVGVQALLVNDCWTSGPSDVNPCHMECIGQEASELKHIFCSWSSDIKVKMADTLINLDVLLESTGTEVNQGGLVPFEDLDATSGKTNFVYYTDIVANYAEKQYNVAVRMLNKFQP